VQTPSPEVEMLLCIADITHERFSITLLDLIWLEGLSKEITNWDLVFTQARKYKWKRSFNVASKIINAMSMEIYKKPIVPNVGLKEAKYSLPYFLPLHYSYLTYLDTVRFTNTIPVTSFAYMHYNRIKYIVSGKKDMPYYSSWMK
jgi:hypothetical protein